jgi:hypothetical protein
MVRLEWSFILRNIHCLLNALYVLYFYFKKEILISEFARLFGHHKGTKKEPI